MPQQKWLISSGRAKAKLWLVWERCSLSWAKATMQGCKTQQNSLSPSCEEALLQEEEEEFHGEWFPIHLGKCVHVDHTGSVMSFTTCCLFLLLCCMSIVQKVILYCTLFYFIHLYPDQGHWESGAYSWETLGVRREYALDRKPVH